MNKLQQHLQKESAHIRLTPQEKSAIRAAVFGAPSPVRVAPSPYIFISQRWMTALAAMLVVVFAGGSTAFAAQGALPGQPLYAIKTQILEPVSVALASTPAAKAAAHVAIAQTRVEEAETLAQKGTLDATTSDALAANFEQNADSAVAIANEVEASDPAAAVQIKTQLTASSAAGGAILAALAEKGSDEQRGHAQGFAVRLLARAGGATSNNGEGMHTTATLAVATAPAQTSGSGDTQGQAKANARTFAATTGAVATTSADAGVSAEVASVNPAREALAASLEQKAAAALKATRAQYATASSTLDATTTVEIETSLSGVGTLISEGSAALGSSLYDTAVKDFTEALGRALKLEALLKAQVQFDNQIIRPLLKFDNDSH